MFKTIAGLILLLIPFLLIYKFKDKKIGFAYILSFLIAFHLLLAVVLQAFGIFNYLIVFGINLLLDMIIIVKTDFKNLFANFKKIKIKKIDWILIFVIALVAFQFYCVHYNYTGEIVSVNLSSSNDSHFKDINSSYFKDINYSYFENFFSNHSGYYNEIQNSYVKNMRYGYPYLSDEWAAVSLIKYSINSGKLPLVNPLWPENSFPNLELPFHSFLSEIILLLDLNPLTQYVLLSIFASTLIAVLVYFILKINKINSFASAIAALSVPYITTGTNLPGLWNLIPLILGIISMSLGFIFMSAKKNKMVLFLGLLTLLFYPPLFVLCSASLIAYFIFSGISKEKKIKYLTIFFGICVLAVLILSLFTFFAWNSFNEFFHYITSKIFYHSYGWLEITKYQIWKVVPALTVLLAGIGAFSINLKKKAWLIAPLITGIFFWWFYSFLLWVFIIEDQRIITSTAFLIVIFSGFGLQVVINYLKKFRFVKKYKILEIVSILILVLFLISSFTYTEREQWKSFKYYNLYSGSEEEPRPSTNYYLHEDDLRLFKGIQQKNFLSIDWKGLVIGAATNNYPLNSKAGTITNSLLDYYEFIAADCTEKTEISKNYTIDYVYSEKFSCSDFKEIGNSSEGLYLYEVNLTSNKKN